jgi:hypothetical protein
VLTSAFMLTGPKEEEEANPASSSMAIAVLSQG